MSTLRAWFGLSQSQSGDGTRRRARRAVPARRTIGSGILMSLFMAIALALALPGGALAVDRLPQTIIFNGLVDVGELPAMHYGDQDFTVSAYSDSHGPITFSIIAGPCTVTDLSVHIAGAGSCTIEAYQPGTSWYFPARAQASFSIYKAFQTITFPSPGSTLAIGATTHRLDRDPPGLERRQRLGRFLSELSAGRSAFL